VFRLYTAATIGFGAYQVESLAACVATAFGPTSLPYARGWTDYIESVRQWFRETAVQGEERQLDVLLEAAPVPDPCRALRPCPSRHCSHSSPVQRRPLRTRSSARGSPGGGDADAGICNSFNIGCCPGTVPYGRIHVCNFRDAASTLVAPSLTNLKGTLVPLAHWTNRTQFQSLKVRLYTTTMIGSGAYHWTPGDDCTRAATQRRSRCISVLRGTKRLVDRSLIALKG
jgi:hypothetical protein